MTEEEVAELTARQRSAETKKRWTRERMVQAAARVIAEDGLSFKPEDVAEEAGVSVATYYNVFKSRNDVFRNVFWDTVALPLRDSVHQASPNPRLATLALNLWLNAFETKSIGKAALFRGMLIDYFEDVTRGEMNCINELGVQLASTMIASAEDLTTEPDPNISAWALQYAVSISHWATIFANFDADKRNLKTFSRHLKLPHDVTTNGGALMQSAHEDEG